MQRRTGPTDPVLHSLNNAVADSLQAIFRGYPEAEGKKAMPAKQLPLRKEPFFGVPPTQQASQGTAQFGLDDEEECPEPLRPTETFSKLHQPSRDADKDAAGQKLGSYQVWTKDRVKELLSKPALSPQDLFVIGSGPQIPATRPKSRDPTKKKSVSKPRTNGVNVIDIDLSSKRKPRQSDSATPAAEPPQQMGLKSAATVPRSLRPPSAKMGSEFGGVGMPQPKQMSMIGVYSPHERPTGLVLTPSDKGYAYIEGERRARRSAPHSSTGSMRDARKSSSRKIEEEKVRLLQLKM